MKQVNRSKKSIWQNEGVYNCLNVCILIWIRNSIKPNFKRIQMQMLLREKCSMLTRDYLFSRKNLHKLFTDENLDYHKRPLLLETVLFRILGISQIFER